MTKKHDGKEIEWAEEQIEIDLDFPEELSEEDRKAYIEFLKETELKFSTDKD